MPAEGVPLTPGSDLLTTSEILRLARLFVNEKVTKIRLTGGEPTIRKDLVSIVAGLNDLRPLGLKDICITTNGIVLKRKLADLKKNGLDHINISLDTLDPLQFELMTRRKGHSNVVDAIHESVAHGFKSVKVNAVVINKVNDHEVVDFIERFTKELPVYVRFIEYMPFDGNKWNDEKFIPYRTLLQRIYEKYGNVQKTPDEPNDTSKSYFIPGYKGRFGFITSMSEHFCGTCNRLRLLANGGLKVCLFGKTEISLRDLMRQGLSDEELLPLISDAVKRKKKQHAGMENLVNMPNKPMILIGG
ncbi:hypothetical protein HDU97_009816 [Phlyctochytrium planicorne]|nr:hypothetical protein HDU97_009816 [Phlyctochytrium planicorne]